MASASNLQTSFLGGEWSPNAQGRMADPRYRTALKRCRNMLPTTEAALVRRFGFRTVFPTHLGRPGRLLPFIKSAEEAYNVELTEGYMRVINRGELYGTEYSFSAIEKEAVTGYTLVTQEGHPFVYNDAIRFDFDADVARQACARLVGRVFFVQPKDANSYYLRGMLSSAILSEDITVSIANDDEAHVRLITLLETPYTDDRWRDVRILQSDDRTVLLQGQTPIQEITPTSIDPVLLVDGPYLDPIPNTELSPSGLTGEIDITLAFTEYEATRSYSIGDYVTDSSVGYVSLVDLNLGNTPSSSPASWEPVLFSEVINGGTGFGTGDNGRHIRLFSEPPLWDTASDYAVGDKVTYGGTYWNALIAMTTNSSTFQPGLLSTTWAPDTTAARWTWGKIVATDTVLIPGQIDPDDGTTFNSSGLGNTASAFDGDTSEQSSGCARKEPGDPAAYIGKNWSVAKIITTARVYPSSNLGIAASDQDEPSPRSGTVYLYASHTLPSGPTNGTLLGSTSFSAGETSGKTITSSDAVTAWEYVWVYGSGGSYIYFAEVEFFGGAFGAQGASITVQLVGDPLLYTSPIRTWRLGLYNNTDPKWPTNGCYHQGRFWLAGAVPNRLDGSKSNDELNFAPTAPDGTIADNNAIDLTFNFAEKNQIIWMKPDRRGVLCGTAGSEILVHATDNNNLITPTSRQADELTHFGCADVPPVHTGLTTVFVNKYPRQLHEGLRDAYSGEWVAPELTEQARHLTKASIVELAYTSALSEIVWARLGDGTLVGTTYKRTNLVSQEPPAYNGFHWHSLGHGRSVVSICPAYSLTDDLDTLAIVTEAEDGIHYVEFGTHFPEVEDTIYDAEYLDGSQVPAAGTFTATGITLLGLNHLNGETVSVFLAGLDCGGGYTVTNGEVEVPFDVAGGLLTAKYVKQLSASGTDFGALDVPIDDGAFRTCAVVGYSFTSQGQTLRPVSPEATGAQNGPALGKTRRNHQFAALLNNAQGLYFGTSFDKLRPALFETGGGRRLTPTQLFSGVFVDTLDDDNSYDGMIAWEVSRPYPASILAIGGFLATQDK